MLNWIRRLRNKPEWWEKDFLLGNPLSERDIEGIESGRGLVSRGALNGKMPFVGRNPADRKWACQIQDCNRPSQFSIVTTAELEIDVPYLRDRNRIQGHQIVPSYHWYHLCDNCLYDYYKSGKTPPVLVEGDEHARLIYDAATNQEIK